MRLTFAALVMASLLGSTRVEAQCNAAQSAVPGRFGVFGYAETLVIVGNLGTPSAGAPGDNGLLFVLPSENVLLHPSMHMWQTDLGSWDGNPLHPCVWSVSTYQPVTASIFYPLPTLPPYYWLEGTPDPSVDLGPGLIICYGWDNTLSVPGDFLPGSKNGILFGLPASHAVTVAAGLVWDVQMYVYSPQDVPSFVETVLPTAMCSFQPQSVAWLAAVTD